jgi:hypothetical protein
MAFSPCKSSYACSGTSLTLGNSPLWGVAPDPVVECLSVKRAGCVPDSLFCADCVISRDSFLSQHPVGKEFLDLYIRLHFHRIMCVLDVWGPRQVTNFVTMSGEYDILVTLMIIDTMEHPSSLSP